MRTGRADVSRGAHLGALGARDCPSRNRKVAVQVPLATTQAPVGSSWASKSRRAHVVAKHDYRRNLLPAGTSKAMRPRRFCPASNLPWGN